MDFTSWHILTDRGEQALQLVALAAGGWALLCGVRAICCFHKVRGTLAVRLQWNFVAEVQTILVTLIFGLLAFSDILPQVPEWIQSMLRIYIFLWVGTTTSNLVNYYRKGG